MFLFIAFQEKTSIINSLQKKAAMTTEVLNQLPGVTCNRTTGAFYAFPKLTLPPRAIAEAKVCDYIEGKIQEGYLKLINLFYSERFSYSVFII